jgi:hypothetical protein
MYLTYTSIIDSKESLTGRHENNIDTEIASAQTVFKALSSKALKIICVGRSPDLFSLWRAFPSLFYGDSGM